jgi:hypothetical protein
MKTITKIIKKEVPTKKGVIHLFWEIEWENPIKLKIMWRNLVLPIWNWEDIIGDMFFSSQDDYVLSDQVREELEELYNVTVL